MSKQQVKINSFISLFVHTTCRLQKQPFSFGESKKKIHFPSASLDCKKVAANVITNLEKQMPFIKAPGEKYATGRPAPAPIYSPNSPPFTKWTKLHSYNLTCRGFWLTSTARRMSHSGQRSAAQSSLVDVFGKVSYGDKKS